MPKCSNLDTCRKKMAGVQHSPPGHPGQQPQGASTNEATEATTEATRARVSRRAPSPSEVNPIQPQLSIHPGSQQLLTEAADLTNPNTSSSTSTVETSVASSTSTLTPDDQSASQSASPATNTAGRPNTPGRLQPARQPQATSAATDLMKKKADQEVERQKKA